VTRLRLSEKREVYLVDDDSSVPTGANAGVKEVMQEDEL
jgi:hypothetical protein